VRAVWHKVGWFDSASTALKNAAAMSVDDARWHRLACGPAAAAHQNQGKNANSIWHGDWKEKLSAGGMGGGRHLSTR
jgi:hypothetical protein